VEPNLRRQFVVPFHNSAPRWTCFAVKVLTLLDKWIRMMSWTDRYRSYAAECVRLARQSTNPIDKALLLEMADSWIRRAERAQGRAHVSDAEKKG
jgi:hypothetical protein